MATMNPPTPGAQQTQQQQQRPHRRAWYNDGELFKFGFVRSNYVDAITEWLLKLAGKSARIVLLATAIYMAAELIPGVSLPAALNNAVFIIQLIVLDVGGVGLFSLARQARTDHNVAGAEAAEKLGKWMMAIMIATLVTAATSASISFFISILDPKDAAHGQEILGAIKSIIELGLVIARSVAAVVYGRVVHEIQGEAPDTSLPPTPVMLDRMAEISAAIQAISLSTERRFQEMDEAFKSALKDAALEMGFQLKAFQEEQVSRLSNIETWVVENLAPMNESLSNLPDFESLEKRMVTTVQTTVSEVRRELATITAGGGAPRMNLPARTVSGDTPARGMRAVSAARETKQNAGAAITAKQWVWERLHEDESRPDEARQAEPYSVPTLLRMALAAGVNTSQGSVHNYRAEYQARRGAGEAYPFQ